ncbi:hypothetical protein SF12_03265, partial [Streptomyces sp. MBRL 601]
MRLDGGLAEGEPRRQFGVGQAPADQAQYLPLARGEDGQVPVDRRDARDRGAGRVAFDQAAGDRGGE